MNPASDSLHSGTSQRIAALLCLLLFAASRTRALAQDIPGASSGPAISRFDLSGAFGYLHPFDSGINQVKFEDIVGGGVFSTAYYFKPHFGIQLEGNYFPNASDDNNCFYTAQAGPIFRFQKRRFIPFAHILVGAAEVGGPAKQSCTTWGYGGTGGGGLDYVLPAFHNHLALRIIQADMTYSHVVNPQPATPNVAYGGIADLYAIKLSAGLNFRFGDIKAPDQSVPILSCTADPINPYPGDPVTISSSIANLKPLKDMQYKWEVTSGRITPHDASASTDTTGLAPGTYTVSGHLQHGPSNKTREIASCTTTFTIRAFEPPTLTCSADRAAINSGDPVVITAKAISPQNRPLTYTYGTSDGILTANGPSAALTTVGARPGAISVTCKVEDDRGQSATATTSVVVATPAPPPPAVIAAAQAQPLCTLSFDRDHKRPNRVNNEAKGCLDDIALALARSTDSKLLLIGNHVPGESNQNAAERAMNAAQYLTDEKGIDGSRIDLRIGSEGSQTVTTMLVPAGATVDSGGTSSFDTSSVKRTGQPYGHTAPPSTARPIHKRQPKPSATPPPF